MFKTVDWRFILPPMLYAMTILLFLKIFLLKEDFGLKLITLSLLEPLVIMFLAERVIHICLSEDG